MAKITAIPAGPHYDLQGNLTRAENSKGHVIELDYGTTPLIQRMLETDRNSNNRHELLFKYNAMGKPVEITLSCVGKINVTYDEKGEIVSVKSDQGTKMALQVTQVFSNLLRVVQVAGTRMDM